MRRGLKQAAALRHVRRHRRFKPIPDEEGTETLTGRVHHEQMPRGFKPIPDEEGTETLTLLVVTIHSSSASNRSPMRRGLKLDWFVIRKMMQYPCFKPIPDEEGTETRGERFHSAQESGRASNRSPMRRGLKHHCDFSFSPSLFQSFKPIPDEEGTETRRPAALRSRAALPASNRSPMRRGLKLARRSGQQQPARASNRSPMRRGLKLFLSCSGLATRSGRASNRSPMRRGLKLALGHLQELR